MADKSVPKPSGWESPITVGAYPGDALTGPAAPYPDGPVPDPIGNMTHKVGKPTDLPTR